MNASIVAMSGCNMPTPFATPVMVIVVPSTSTAVDAAFATVSVVMIASVASAQRSAASDANAAGNAASIFATGNGSRMTPVENGSTSPIEQPTSRATTSQLRSAAAMPSSPVPQFALPALTTSARIDAPAPRCRRQICTGAAAKPFCVKTPATRLPGANRITIRSRRLAFLMPASAKPSSTPRTGRMRAGSGGESLTGMAASNRGGSDRGATGREL